jgi:glycosyltransferase involved in cell wall biosynthesis
MLKAITVAKDEEKLIGKCIKRVLRQTYPVYSHTIIDDFSSDKTTEIVQELNDGRIHLFRAKDFGFAIQSRQLGKRIHSLQQLAIDLLGDWHYLLVVDADTKIPTNYCETIRNAMENDKKLVLAGAKYLKTPTKLEASGDTHVRGSNYIVKRSFYDWFRKRGFDYKNQFGEVLLERYAKALGYKVKAFPITVVQGRETTIQGQGLVGGINEYMISTPLLLVIMNFLRNPSLNDLLVLCGWLWAKIFCVKKYFSKMEDRRIASWYIKRWLRHGSNALPDHQRTYQ